MNPFSFCDRKCSVDWFYLEWEKRREGAHSKLGVFTNNIITSHFTFLAPHVDQPLSLCVILDFGSTTLYHYRYYRPGKEKEKT